MAPKSEKQGGKSKYSNKELSTLTKGLNENFHFDTPKGIINAKSNLSYGLKVMLIVFFDLALMMPLGVSKWKFSFKTFVSVLSSLFEYFDFPPCFSDFGAILSSMKMLQLLLL
jgi:hypothetical protein